ncbi:MAG: peptidylprolyl isomerase [Phycisphaerales bacterium]|nr:peptidylprolyl isomerase [Phycisphaerales bacterium]
MAILHVGCDKRVEPASKTGPLPGLETTRHDIQAVIDTAKGRIVMDLETDEAPVLCANFMNLVQRRFYDGLTFYRSSSVIRQAGNPYDTESRLYKPGYRLLPEYSPELAFNKPGMVACVFFGNTDPPDIRPTEFFLAVKPQDRWTFKYPIFASITDGLSVAKSLEDGDVIQSIRLLGDPGAFLNTHADIVAGWNQQLDANPPGPNAN